MKAQGELNPAVGSLRRDKIHFVLLVHGLRFVSRAAGRVVVHRRPRDQERTGGLCAWWCCWWWWCSNTGREQTEWEAWRTPGLSSRQHACRVLNLVHAPTNIFSREAPRLTSSHRGHADPTAHIGSRASAQ